MLCYFCFNTIVILFYYHIFLELDDTPALCIYNGQNPADIVCEGKKKARMALVCPSSTSYFNKLITLVCT